MDSRQPILLYDGDCGFCQVAVDRFQMIDRQNQIACVPSHLYAHLTPALERQAQVEIIYIDQGREFGGADGALRAYCRLRRWSLLQLFRIPPFIWVARAAYKLVARNRLLISRWLGIPATCEIPKTKD